MSGEIETLHRPFARYLREQGLYFLNSRSDCPSTIIEGHADFTIIHRSGVLLIEFKDVGGSLSSEQKKRKAELAATGTKVHVLRDLQTAIDLVTAWHSTLKEPPAVAAKEVPCVIWGGRKYEERDGELHRISEG
jgi:hypothetical protein